MAFGIIVSSSAAAAAYSYLQLSNIITPSIKVTSPNTGQQVPVGELTISGTSTDNATFDCTVYADWNNTKPFQKAVATGPGGVNDYSTWTFTYTPEYHLITTGTNNLTSKLSCVGDDSSSVNLTKYHSVNLTGVAAMVSTSISSKNIQHRQQVASFNIDNGSSPDNKAAREEITTSNISNPSVIWPIVAENFNLSTANSINKTGATITQIASEEQHPAVTAATPITTSNSSMVEPCCTSNGYIANAGPDQAILEGTKITLNGNGGNNNNSNNFVNNANYLWRQMAGPAIILKGNNTAHPNFIAPNYPNDTKYTFALEVFDENQFNNNNQTVSAIDTVDIMVKDVNTKSKKDGSFQEQVLASNYESQSETESFMVAPTNGENDDEEEEEEENADRSDTSSLAAANQYDQVEEIEKVKEEEKADTDSVIKDEMKKGSESEEDEQEKQKPHDKSEQETEESELQIEKLKEEEKRQEDYDDDGSGSNSDSNFIDNHITSFSNNNNDHKENDVFIFNYDIKLKKFTEKMNQNIENLKDRLENSFNER
jgi:hypothetical protein